MELSTFRNFDTSCVRLPMFTVYRNPADFPSQFVARLFDIDKPTTYFVLGTSEKDIIEKLPLGLERLDRNPGDSPVIVCVYL